MTLEAEHKEGITIIYGVSPPDGSPLQVAALNFIPSADNLGTLMFLRMNADAAEKGITAPLAIYGFLVSDPRIQVEIFEENANPCSATGYEPQFPNLQDWVSKSAPLSLNYPVKAWHADATLQPTEHNPLDLGEGAE